MTHFAKTDLDLCHLQNYCICKQYLSDCRSCSGIQTYRTHSETHFRKTRRATYAFVPVTSSENSERKAFTSQTMKPIGGLRGINRVLQTRRQTIATTACGFCAIWGGFSDGISLSSQRLCTASSHS